MVEQAKHELNGREKVKIQSTNGHGGGQSAVAGEDGGAGPDGGNSASHGEEMPGRLIMDQQGVVGSQDLKKDRSHAQPPPEQPETNGDLHHGANGVLPNGVPPPSEILSRTNGDLGHSTTALADAATPPVLDQSWRDHHSNKSLGLMMERVAQQCYFDLNETLTSMSDIPAEPQHQMLNGVTQHAVQDTSDGSLKKKELLLEYAQNQRERFIKTLVLSDWCKNEEEKQTLIDVKVWQDKQNDAHTGATRAVGQTKLNMINAKMSNPNIEGAMELLATGKASWVPDLGYIPPKRLSAKQLLKTLRNMNVALSMRLNLHEDLPAYFDEFLIADGRATFTVRDEFEVDLSIADEDPATPFYFIDIRLLFQPTSNIIGDRFRGFMEGKANQELATKGLRGCYAFLHNFVLTHKINVLKSQASELIQGKWFDCIRVENLRRSVVVQYWATRPGPKSWIEIGISSGKQKAGRPRKPPTPRIQIRWFRHGVEVTDEALDFDWQDLSLERCLSIVIEKHTASVLKDLRDRIRGLAPEGSPFATEVVPGSSASEHGALLLSMPSLRHSLDVRIDSVTGQFSISPPSPATAATERRLNTDPLADVAKWLGGLAPAVVQEGARGTATLLDWTNLTHLIRQDNLQKTFGEPIRQFSVFRPKKAWGEQRALAITFSLAGEKWWAVVIETKRNEQGKEVGKIITDARPVSLPHEITENAVSVSRATLMRVEKAAVADVAFDAVSTQLKEMRIPHRLEKLVPRKGRDQANALGASRSLALSLRFSSLMRDPQMKAWKSWANELVRLTHQGLVDAPGEYSEGAGNVRHDLRLTLEPGKMKELRKHLSYPGDRTLAMNDTGGLALRFLTPFGQPFVKQIQSRLRNLERLDGYVATLKERRFACTHVSLSRLTFTYNRTPELSAELDLSNLSAKLNLEPLDSNPHVRIKDMLKQGLNQTAHLGLQALTYILSFTLPILQVFDRLESITATKRAFTVHPRTSTWYRVTYSAPLPSCIVDIRAKQKIDGRTKSAKWHIEGVRTVAKDGSLPEELAKALKELWQQSGEHWEGLSNGIVAGPQGVGDALEKLDGIIRRFEGSMTEVAPANAPASASQQAAPSKATSTVKTETQTKRAAKQEPAAAIKKEPDVIMLD